MKKIKHIFFDLDHTIWDFEKNSSESLHELFFEQELDREIRSVSDFIQAYQVINAEYWVKYRNGLIDKETVRVGRFIDALNQFGVSQTEEKAHKLGHAYIERTPKKTHLFPHAHETLAYLKDKYPLHIITNGFAEIVDIKLACSGLTDYFDIVVAAEETGKKKPDPSVFQAAMSKAGSLPLESLMVGDNLEADVEGALKSGMKAVFFNPHRSIHEHFAHEIHCLSDLQKIL